MTTTETDVVALLIGQHMRIRDLFAEVQTATGDQRATAFADLVRLLAVHETAEELIVHPAARSAIDGGDALVDDRLTEEREAKEMLSQLEELGPDHPDFPARLAELRAAVLEHAHREEAYEFRYLRAHYGQTRLQTLATAVRLAEKAAPTHPHPGVESAAANVVLGPVTALFDRVRDAVRTTLSTDDHP